jgi:hypothetical protein
MRVLLSKRWATPVAAAIAHPDSLPLRNGFFRIAGLGQVTSRRRVVQIVTAAHTAT